jgi:hypothetical protein
MEVRCWGLENVLLGIFFLEMGQIPHLMCVILSQDHREMSVQV